jgi:superfamily II DNA or RNA helicase
MAFSFDFLDKIIEAHNTPEFKDTLISTERIDYIVSKFFRYYQQDMWATFKNTFEYAKQGEKAWHFKAGTGSGKTEVFKFIAPYMMAKAKEEGNNEGLVFGLICHRLCLIEDLRNRIIPIMFNKPEYNDISLYGKRVNPAGCGLDENKIKFYIVNSGSYKTTNISNIDKKEDIDSNIETRSDTLDKCLNKANHVKDYIDNNNFSALEKEIADNRKKGIHSMFICLYQSVARYEKKLSKLNFDFIVGDECHAVNNMGAEVFKGCANFFDTVKKSYFFSATPQYHKDDPFIGNNQVCMKKVNDQTNEIEE